MITLTRYAFFARFLLKRFYMRLSIHPAYHEKATITCSCGNVLTVGSTKETMHTEVCSNCHPFYTGKKKLMDTAGRVERFKARGEKSKALQAQKALRKNSAKKSTE